MPLVSRAMARLRAAPGVKGKIRELRVLSTRARAHLRRRTALAAALEAVTEPARLDELLTVPRPAPDCLPLGGGALSISLSQFPGEDLHIIIRDRKGVSHSARVMKRIVRPSGGSGAGIVDGTVQIIAQAPLELLGQEPGIEVEIREGTQSVVFPDIRLECRTDLSDGRLSVDNNLVMFSGMADGNRTAELKLGLFVDGDITASIAVAPQGARFNGAVLIDPCHLDGAIHHLELRELPNMAILASAYEFLPLHVTPWDALQDYARAPLDGTLSPAARHHFRSYQLWLDKVARDPTDAPPVSHLYTEILHGFRKRRDYPKLEFPAHEAPVASVVIPVHNKFEVTYLCLCSLLFAYNDASFEVIVVDDGSSDETREIGQCVSGVRVLRHETAKGFVDSCNAGAALAKGEFVAFLNNDTETTARWLDELVSVCRSFDNIGLVGSKLVYPNGKLQEAGGVIWGSGDPWNVGRNGNAHDPRYNYLRRVDYVSGAALMLPRAIWEKVGGFSAEFAPGYFEDTDLAMKVRDAGHLVVYVPSSTIFHFEGKSAGTDTGSGMKRFQEVNRPKFKQKWGHAVASHAPVGVDLDREKDRGAAFRVLFLDHQFPMVDGDAGSYAAFQEIRLFQALGAKVTFLPRNLAWMDRHTTALQRIGVEALYAPYVTIYDDFLRARAREFDVVFVCRYQIAEHIIPLVRAASPSTRIVFNLADLHFLRELREAAAGSTGATRKRAEDTRAAELAVVQASDLTFSYSDVELAVLESHVKQSCALARLPWVVDLKPLARSFADTQGLLFLGGFSHPPNAEAVKFFARDVMPALRERLADIRLGVVGKGAEAALADVSCDALHVVGHVADLDAVMARARIFVAPLLTGAGLKGKVIEAISRGVPCVLSPIAAEGTGLVDGVSCLVATTALEWVECIARLYSDEALWQEMAANALKLVDAKYTFEPALDAFEQALARIGVEGKRKGALIYRQSRPPRYGV